MSGPHASRWVQLDAQAGRWQDHSKKTSLSLFLAIISDAERLQQPLHALHKVFL